MTQLRIYKKATVEFSEDDVKALSPTLTRRNSDGEIVVRPPDFPLVKAQVVFNGSRAMVSLPEPGSKHRRIVTLNDATLTDPKRNGDPVIIEGTATELTRLQLDAEKARVRITITSYSSCATCR